MDDIGIGLDPKLKFSEHISSIVNKAMSVLRLIKKWATEFKDHYKPKTLYISLVRPFLEFGSCVWSPYILIYKDRRNQYKRIFALRGLNSYQHSRALFMRPLSVRQQRSSVVWA